MNKIDMIEVESSNVSHIGHENDTLYVFFKNDSLYKYDGVKEDVFIDMTTAESIGKFMNKYIKKTYTCERIWDDDEVYTEIVGGIIDKIFNQPAPLDETE